MQERHICLQQKGKKIEDGILCKTKVWQMQFLCFIVLLLSQGIFCRKCLLLTKWKHCNSYCWYIHSYSCGRYHDSTDRQALCFERSNRNAICVSSANAALKSGLSHLSVARSCITRPLNASCKWIVSLGISRNLVAINCLLFPEKCTWNSGFVNRYSNSF